MIECRRYIYNFFKNVTAQVFLIDG